MVYRPLSTSILSGSWGQFPFLFSLPTLEIEPRPPALMEMKSTLTTGQCYPPLYIESSQNNEIKLGLI